MSLINPAKAEDRATLLDFYQLKTLDPRDYQHDSIQSAFKIDLSTEDLSQIPNDVVNHLLGDNMNDLTDAAVNDDSNSNNNNNNNNNNNAEILNTGRRTSNSVKRQLSTHSKATYNDALGFHANILDELIDKDILDDTRDPQLNKFMVDSKLFNPKLFLSVIHNDKSLNELMQGIRNLQNDIEAKKPLLQQLITNNFEKTLSSKNSLDKVYKDFSSSNLDSEIDNLNKNLAYSNNSANQLLNPVLLKISKEQELTIALDFISQNKFFLDLPKKLKSYIDEDDFDSFLKEYERGSKSYQASKRSSKRNPLFDKIWSNVEKLVNDYKNSMINELKKIHIESISSNFKLQINNSKNSSSNFVILIKRLIELGHLEGKNPIKEFITFQYNHILEDLDKGLARINYKRLSDARNSILNAYHTKNNNDDIADIIDTEIFTQTTMKRLFSIFESPTFTVEQIDKMYEKLDFPLIIQLWNMLSDYVYDVSEEVIGKKILRFETIVEFFLDDFEKLLNKKATTNPESYKITNSDLSQMKEYFTSMITKICGRFQYFFSCTTSDLTTALKISSTEGPRAVFPPVGKKDLNDISSFGFIPPNSNSISTICYAVHIHDMITNRLTDLKNNNFILHSPNLMHTIDSTLRSVNENIITGCLATLNADLTRIFEFDKMAPSDTIEGATRVITFLQNYYKVFISKLSKLYIFDNKELLDTIKKQFLSSFNILLEGMATNIGRQCREDPSKLDYYYLATIYDMRNLTQKIVPAILKSFDINLQTNLFNEYSLEIRKKFDSYEYDLFSEYMRDPLTTVKTIVGGGISNINSDSKGVLIRLAAGETIPVSSYILKTINYINTLKSRLINFKIRFSFIRDVQSSLIGQFQKKIVDNLSLQFTDDGLYQVLLDINLLLVLLNKYNSKCSESNKTDTTKLERAYQKLISKIDASSLDKNVQENITSNYAQFECFITN